MPHRQAQGAGEKIIRRAFLERRLMEMEKDIGQKVALTIGKYHAQQIEGRLVAIETRLEWIDTPWYRKLWIRAKDISKRMWAGIKGLGANVWTILRLGGHEPPEPEPEPERPEGVLQRGDAVETTEVGDKLFKGEHQEGVVTWAEDGKVAVMREEDDTPLVYSPSVWQLQATPNPNEAGNSVVVGEPVDA